MENLERLVKVEESSKSAHHRLDSIESEIKEMEVDIKNNNKIAIAVEKLAEQMKNTTDTIVKIDTRVKNIEDKPGKKWEGLSDKIISVFVNLVLGGIIGALVSMVIIK